MKIIKTIKIWITIKKIINITNIVREKLELMENKNKYDYKNNNK